MADKTKRQSITIQNQDDGRYPLMILVNGDHWSNAETAADAFAQIAMHLADVCGVEIKSYANGVFTGREA